MAAEKSNQTENHRVVSLKVYLGIWGSLLVLTAMTIRISLINLGGWNVVIALLIASIKGMLVALFFMHLYYDKKIYSIVFSMGLVLLSIFIGLTMFDTLNRGEIYEIKAEKVKKEAVIYDSLAAPDTSAVKDSTAR